MVSAVLIFSLSSWALDYDAKCTEILDKVKRGETDVNFTSLRLNCAKTSWYQGRKQTRIDKLKWQMYGEAQNGNFIEVKRLAQSMLDLNYLNMDAHRTLAWALENLGDSASAKRFRDIEIGLLRSIGQSGSGKSCKEGKVVIDVEEEYFVMQIMGWKLKQQQVVTEENSRCDLLIVEENGVERREFFNVDIVFENYKKSYKF